MNPPTKNKHIIMRIVDAEALLLNDADGEIHQLNATAALIWSSCNGQNSVDDISVLLMEEFEMNESNVQADVINTIESLKKLNLLE